MPALPTAETASSFWPTPAAGLPNDGEEPETLEARRLLLKAKHQNGNGVGTPLAIAAKRWPTPVARDFKGQDMPNRVGTASLGDLAARWPTPMVSDVTRGSGTYMRGNPTLKGAAVKWPTPGANEDGYRLQGDSQSNGLAATAMKWPTPTSTDAKASGAAGYSTASGRHAGVTLTDAACRGLLAPTTPKDGASTSTSGRALNPRFVEALMGWPDGWTDCAYWETELCPTRSLSFGPCSGAA